jgi:hypothetical protein
MSGTEIYCPRCRRKPRPEDRWVCTRKIGGCGHSWDTFSTRGICPRCNWHWIITSCHACRRFSPHEDWYHEPERLPRETATAGSSDQLE